MSMEICTSHDYDIVYEDQNGSKECPMCELVGELDKARDEASDLSKEVSNLEETIKELESKLEGKNEVK